MRWRSIAAVAVGACLAMAQTAGASPTPLFTPEDLVKQSAVVALVTCDAPDS